MNTLQITKKEAAKVVHDINNVWNDRFKDKRICTIETHSNEADSPSYEYIFLNNGFNEYEFVAKYPTVDRR